MIAQRSGQAHILKDIIESLISSVAAMMVLRRPEGELREIVGDLCWYCVILSDGAIGSLWASVGVCRPLSIHLNTHERADRSWSTAFTP